MKAASPVQIIKNKKKVVSQMKAANPVQIIKNKKKVVSQMKAASPVHIIKNKKKVVSRLDEYIGFDQPFLPCPIEKSGA